MAEHALATVTNIFEGARLSRAEYWEEVEAAERRFAVMISRTANDELIKAVQCNEVYLQKYDQKVDVSRKMDFINRLPATTTGVFLKRFAELIEDRAMDSISMLPIRDFNNMLGNTNWRYTIPLGVELWQISQDIAEDRHTSIHAVAEAVALHSYPENELLLPEFGLDQLIPKPTHLRLVK